MKMIANPSRTAAPQVRPVDLASISSQEYGKALLTSAGIDSLESRKEAFLGDPGTSVTVEQNGPSYIVSGHPSESGWFVIQSSPGHLSATHFETDKGAIAQLWAVSAMQDEILPQVNTSTTDSRISFRANGPHGETVVTAIKL
jgi:hypothetical protein